ncbi:hypothetical protein Fcan01_18877 [Folsomia candida]|uniref:Uncharacterized protein n=1 Tax=Folsomia candida TaxID=158441 RepID=A0A226DNT5_FOLCA|nr:hypothetical protein Fcan01_18877 [Folsomia candida]
MTDIFLLECHPPSHSVTLTLTGSGPRHLSEDVNLCQILPPRGHQHHHGLAFGPHPPVEGLRCYKCKFKDLPNTCDGSADCMGTTMDGEGHMFTLGYIYFFFTSDSEVRRMRTDDHSSCFVDRVKGRGCTEPRDDVYVYWPDNSCDDNACTCRTDLCNGPELRPKRRKKGLNCNVCRGRVKIPADTSRRRWASAEDSVSHGFGSLLRVSGSGSGSGSSSDTKFKNPKLSGSGSGPKNVMSKFRVRVGFGYGLRTRNPNQTFLDRYHKKILEKLLNYMFFSGCNTEYKFSPCLKIKNIFGFSGSGFGFEPPVRVRVRVPANGNGFFGFGLASGFGSVASDNCSNFKYEDDPHDFWKNKAKCPDEWEKPFCYLHKTYGGGCDGENSTAFFLDDLSEFVGPCNDAGCKCDDADYCNGLIILGKKNPNKASEVKGSTRFGVIAALVGVAYGVGRRYFAGVKANEVKGSTRFGVIAESWDHASLSISGL